MCGTRRSKAELKSEAAGGGARATQAARTCTSRLFFGTVITPMLDLNFVRDNLPLVEEKLRLRGMDPGEVLKNFQEVDTQRRQAITQAETAKARRNRASEEIAKLKKSGQDTTAQISETKDLREHI